MPRKKALDDPQKVGKQSAILKCAICRGKLDASGWCAACICWPGNVRPRRRGECGDVVDSSGWCHRCKRFQATRLEYTDENKGGKWIDTRRTDVLLDKDTNQQRMQFLMDCIGKGDKAALLDWAKHCAKAQPGIGWEQAISELEAESEQVPF